MRIPWWVSIYAVLTALTCGVGIFGGYIDPGFFYAELPADQPIDPVVWHLAGVWGSKNLAIVLLGIVSVIRRDLRWLAALFAIKFVSDSIDILYVNTAFREGAAGDLLTNLITWTILALPSALAVWSLERRAARAVA